MAIVLIVRAGTITRKENHQTSKWEKVSVSGEVCRELVDRAEQGTSALDSGTTAGSVLALLQY